MATDRAILRIIENYYMRIPEVDGDEIWKASSKVTNGKAGEEDLTIPEMLKESGDPHIIFDSQRICLTSVCYTEKFQRCG